MVQFGEALTKFWYTILRRKGIILYTFLAIFFATIYFTNQQSPVYLAQATIKVGQPKAMGEFILGKESGPEIDMETEVRLIKGFIIEEGVKKGLAYESERLAHQEVSRMTSRLIEEDIEVERVKGSNLIEIRAMASTPEQAAELANKVAQLYIDLSLERKLKEVRSIRQSIEKQMIASKAKLDESERLLEEFKKREGNIVLKKKTFDDRLLALQLKLSQLSQNYPEESPILKDLKGQIESIKEQLKILAGKELELVRLTRAFEYDLRTYEDWQGQATAAQITEKDEMPDVGIVEPAVWPQHPTSPNKLLNGFVGAVVGLMIGVFLAFSMETAGTSLRTIEAVEGFMKLPVLGVIPYLATEEGKGRLWQWTHYTKPADTISRLRNQLVIRYNPQSPIVESYKSLRTNVQSMVLEKSAKTLLVTSAGPGEGKSITVVNLAIVMAQAGHKVLLVDADLRRPTLYKIFGLDREPGLTDCLTGTAKWEKALSTIVDILMKSTGWEEVLETPGLDNVNIISCGHIVHNPAELLGSEQMKSLLEELKANFNLILFDTPPVLTIADASIMGRELDGSILVYQVGKVAGGALRRTKEQLESGGVKVWGIVLNNTTREAGTYPSYRYYRYKYYTQEAQKSAKPQR